MKITTAPGNKNERGNDRKVFIQQIQQLTLKGKDGYWEQVNIEEILDLIEKVFANEDAIYPRPKFKGSGMFLDEILKRYTKHLNGNDSLIRYFK